jgi:uncharacterized protein (TIGR01244 family)
MLVHRLRLLIILAALAVIASPSAPARAETDEAPPPAAIGAAIANYTKLRPGIATGGTVRPDALATLKSLGFVTVLDLRAAEERPELEKAAAEQAGLHYINIPIADAPPTEAQIAAFGRIVEDTGTYPLLVHCGSGNRVGALWTLYRTRAGIPFAAALAEGRRIGLQGAREAVVRQLLGDLAR